MSADPRAETVRQAIAEQSSGLTGLSAGHGDRGNLLTELLGAYPADATGEEIIETLTRFVADAGQDMLAIVAEHLPGSDRYVWQRDWVYGCLEALMVADRSMACPSKLRAVLAHSDHEAVIAPMVEVFAQMGAECALAQVTK
ncbi:hypothetical protein [Branchiibius sp. NY16-3462-2]|uniref:hypothetical protein n=1 Tax=Branchiibius sp. NY16-3462-2 TaxID=1807500 RepID=UPI0007931066|nr:hypothetical protein [Branchiibius sp. NY16-3462-2]KYH44785.1 hypothetical protein AZH51_12220 [Branchiibius sp. NY16-3462-2]